MKVVVAVCNGGELGAELVTGVRSDDFVKPAGFGGGVFGGEDFYDITMSQMGI